MLNSLSKVKIFALNRKRHNLKVLDCIFPDFFITYITAYRANESSYPRPSMSAD